MGASIGIIGAGIAGIAAAKELTELGNTVDLFEAHTVVGGRIKTAFLENTHKEPVPIDLGSTFLFGDAWDYAEEAQKNPLFDLIKHLPDASPLQAVDFLEKAEIYDENGTNIQPKIKACIHSHAFRHRMEAFLHEQEQVLLAQQRGQGSPQNPLPCLNEILKKVFPPNPSEEDKLIQHILETSFSHKHGANLNQISLWNLVSENSYQGHDYCAPGAFSKLVHHMLHSVQAMPNFTLHLNSPVVGLKHLTEKNQVALTTKNQDTFTFDYVLCTVPLGVLKKSSLQFHPTLSPEKTAAIQALRLAHSNKVILQFEKPFWSPDAHALLIMDAHKQLYEYLNVDHFLKQDTHALAVTLYGEAADFREKSDESIRKQVLVPLAQVYGNRLTPLKKCLITRWEQDPYIHGAWTYLGPNATQQHLLDIGKAEWNNRLFFAGEHASPNYYASIHGAYSSGVTSGLAIDHNAQAHPHQGYPKKRN